MDNELQKTARAFNRLRDLILDRMETDRLCYGRHIRSAGRWTCIAMSLALAPPARVLAGEPADSSRSTWVRVTTGTEVAGEGFAMGSETRGRLVSHDKRTATFDVKGRPVRVAKPGTTLQGAVQTLAEKYLILAVAGESPIVVPRDAISNLDVRRRESKKGLGVGIGLLAGGAIGYAIGAARSGPGCQGWETGIDLLCTLDGIEKPGGAILGVVSGAVLGFAVAPGAKWDKGLPLDRVHVSIGPTRNRGIGLTLSLAF